MVLVCEDVEGVCLAGGEEQRLSWITGDLKLLLSAHVVVSRSVRPHGITTAVANCRLKKKLLLQLLLRQGGRRCTSSRTPHLMVSRPPPRLLFQQFAPQENCPLCLPAAFWLDGRPPPGRGSPRPEVTLIDFFVLFFCQTPPRVLHCDKRKGGSGS